METHILTGEIKGDTYRKFIQYLVETSDTFMLVFLDPPLPKGSKGKINYYEETAKTRKLLAPYLIKSRKNTVWPGTVQGDGDISLTRDDYIDIYRASLDLLPFLFKPDDIHNWVPPYPQDLCFFRKGYCWMDNTVHERMTSIHCQTEEDARLLDRLGVRHDVYKNWPTELFYENYTL